MDNNKILEILVITFIIMYFTFSISYLILYPINMQHSSDKSCKGLGFEKYTNQNNMPYCEDSEGNLHYIKKSNCTFWGNNCLVKKITVGKVEVAP